MEQVHSRDAELNILQHIAKSQNPHLLALVNTDWFYDEQLKYVLFQWKQEGIVIDKLTMRIRKPLACLDEVYSEPTYDFQPAVNAVSQKSTQRTIGIKLQEVSSIVYDTDPAQVAIELATFFQNIASKGNKVQKLDEGLTQEVVDLIDFGDKRPGLNKLLLSFKDLMVIGGDSGQHKTNQLLDILICALEANIQTNPEFKCLFFSKEMSYENLRNRIIAKKFGMTLEFVKRKQFILADLKKRMQDECPHLINNLLIISPEQFNTASDMAKFIIQEKANIWGLDFLQYAAQMAYKNDAKEQNVNVMQLIAECKVLSQLTNSLGIPLSQVKKESDTRLTHFPRLNDLEWSGLTKQLAAAIAMVVWPWKINANDYPRKDVYICSWQKVRDANIFNEWLYVTPEHCDFTSMDKSVSDIYKKYLEC